MKTMLIPISSLTLSKPETDERHPDCCLIIEFEDKGQDFLYFQLDKNGFVVKATPFQNEIWKGAYIPLSMLKVGKELPIHHPPNINFGFLKHIVKNIITE
jgi:hypothetical protein